MEDDGNETVISSGIIASVDNVGGASSVNIKAEWGFRESFLEMGTLEGHALIDQLIRSSDVCLISLVRSWLNLSGLEAFLSPGGDFSFFCPSPSSVDFTVELSEGNFLPFLCNFLARLCLRVPSLALCQM